MPIKRDMPQRLWRNVFYPPPNYVYFEKRPAEFSSSHSSRTIGKLNLLKAAWMADAAMLAYGKSGPDSIPLAQFAKTLDAAGFVHYDLLGDWSGGPKGTQGYFANTTEFAVLAFRGTEKDDWRDLAADLATWPVAEDRTESAAGVKKTMFHLPSALGVFDPSQPGVHRGFQAALNEVWDNAARMLDEYRAKFPNGEIFFTGHSLGAALATLALSRFEGGNASLYTIGSPRVGNGAFVEKVRVKATAGQFRFVDNNDLVTRVPPGLMWYAHGPATLYHIDSLGSIQDCTADTAHQAGDLQELHRDLKCLAELRFPIELDSVPPDDLYDHSPGRYCNYLWNAL
jgi:triacylglycerol lipase